CNGPAMVPGPSARAASTSARLVMDLEPGTASRARTGPVAAGAAQRPACCAVCSIQVSLVRHPAEAGRPPRGDAAAAGKRTDQVWRSGFLAMKRHILYIPQPFLRHPGESTCAA